MKKLSYILFLSIIAICTSCGNDEPDHIKPDEITRSEDGNGKVFIENGKLVEGNIDYSAADLKNALDHYDWQREYCIYYDNKYVSGRVDALYMPSTFFSTGHKFVYLKNASGQREIRTVESKNKLLLASVDFDPTSSSYYITDEFIVVALDFNGENGRMVLDYKLHRDVTGYDINSSYVRMVWKMVPSE